MPPARSRIGPVLTDGEGHCVREALLRVEPAIDIYVREKWDPRAPRRLPALLLHGAAMDGSGWDVPEDGVSLANALARNGSHTFALDFRGHGRSSRVPDGRSSTAGAAIADTLEVLEYALETTGSAQAVLVGESFGSMVAPAVAERRPARIAALALLGFIYRTVALPPEVVQAATLVEYCGYSYVREDEWPNVTIPSASAAVIAWHQAQFGAAYAFPIGPLVGSTLPFCNAPGRIGGRVLVVTGDRDTLASVADVEEFLRVVGASHAEHLRLEGVGHLPYVERSAAEVQRAICALIDAATADSERNNPSGIGATQAHDRPR